MTRAEKMERLVDLIWEWYDNPSAWRLGKVKKLMVELRRKK